MAEKIQTEEHYRRVCTYLDFYVTRMDNCFKLFVQVSTATIGGFIWLKMQPNAKEVEYLFPLASLIIPFVAFFTALEIGSLLYGWYGLRKMEAELLGRSDLMPKFPKSGRLEMVRIIGIFCAGVASYAFLH
jgi:hypothetical protein